MKVKDAKCYQYEHGKHIWFKCPWCGRRCDRWDSEFQRGFVTTGEKNLYLHVKCGHYVKAIV